MRGSFGRQRQGQQPLVVRPGDPPEVLGRFFDAAFDAVYPYLARRCGGDLTVAEDLTQETFASVTQLDPSTGETIRVIDLDLSAGEVASAQTGGLQATADGAG